MMSEQFKREMGEYRGWFDEGAEFLYDELVKGNEIWETAEYMRRKRQCLFERVMRDMPPPVPPPLPRTDIAYQLDTVADELAAVRSADDASLAEISRRFAAREDRELEGLLGHAFGGER